MSIYSKSTRKSSVYPGSSSAQSKFPAALKASATLNFGSIPAQESADLTIALKGAKLGDTVILGTPTPTAHTSYTGFVGEDHIVTVRCNNHSSGAVDPASGVFNVTVVPAK